jgi:hypothetical protein
VSGKKMQVESGEAVTGFWNLDFRFWIWLFEFGICLGFRN